MLILIGLVMLQFLTILVKFPMLNRTTTHRKATNIFVETEMKAREAI
jgi:hypothetical protein